MEHDGIDINMLPLSPNLQAFDRIGLNVPQVLVDELAEVSFQRNSPRDHFQFVRGPKFFNFKSRFWIRIRHVNLEATVQGLLTR